MGGRGLWARVAFQNWRVQREERIGDFDNSAMNLGRVGLAYVQAYEIYSNDHH